jgi:hypothetical protein
MPFFCSILTTKKGEMHDPRDVLTTLIDHYTLYTGMEQHIVPHRYVQRRKRGREGDKEGRKEKERVRSSRCLTRLYPGAGCGASVTLSGQ